MLRHISRGWNTANDQLMLSIIPLHTPVFKLLISRVPAGKAIFKKITHKDWRVIDIHVFVSSLFSLVFFIISVVSLLALSLIIITKDLYLKIKFIYSKRNLLVIFYFCYTTLYEKINLPSSLSNDKNKIFPFLL